MKNNSGPIPSNTNPVRGKLVLIAKIAFVGILLFYMVKHGFISVQATRRALSQWKMILPAYAISFTGAFLGVIRWQWLLRAQSLNLKWHRTAQLSFIGNFFNIALPGAVSGDLIKAYYVGREVKGNRTRAFGSILFDRVAGVSALVLLSAGALTLGVHRFSGTLMFRAIHSIVTLAAVVVISFYGYLFLVRETHDPLLLFMRGIENRVPKFGTLTRVYEALRHYHNHRLTVLKVLLISITIHLLVGCAALIFARTLGESAIPILPIYVVVPLGLLVTAIPIAPAGIGAGNVAFLYLFGLIGSNRGADVFSLLALGNIMVGTLGGVIYLRFKEIGEIPSELPLNV